MPRPRSQTIVLSTAAIACSSAVLAPSPALATGCRQTLVQDTNHARIYHDRRAYRVPYDLTRVAQRWAQWMATHHSVQHNPNITWQVHGWRDLGENVGAGGSASAVHRAFMSSPPHRRNILSWTYTQVGIGTARDSRGRLYVDEVFRRPSS